MTKENDALADITSKAVQYVDIGCNDDTFLKSYKNPALDLVGLPD
jgi:hypothetical protein